jgi:hypothetical protein
MNDQLPDGAPTRALVRRVSWPFNTYTHGELCDEADRPIGTIARVERRRSVYDFVGEKVPWRPRLGY